MYSHNITCRPFQSTSERDGLPSYIVWSRDATKCISAQSLVPRSPVSLQKHSKETKERQMWIFDNTNQVIRNAAYNNMVLTVYPDSLFVYLDNFSQNNNYQKWKVVIPNNEYSCNNIFSVAMPNYYGMTNYQNQSLENTPICIEDLNPFIGDWCIMP
jgi:hypothetical protein